MAPSHASTLSGLFTQLPKRPPLFPSQNEAETTLSPSMASSKTIPKGGDPSNPQEQSDTREGLGQGIQTQVTPEDSDAGYQLHSMKGGGSMSPQQTFLSQPRYIPSFDFGGNDVLTLDISPIASCIVEKPVSMIQSSPDTSQPHTPGSSQCSQLPSTLA